MTRDCATVPNVPEGHDSHLDAGYPQQRVLKAEPGTVLSADQAMELALDAARMGIRGANPLVGAVLVDSEHRLQQVGWHRGAGTPHAEADALAKARAAGDDLSASTMYVSLEPCNHTGRTGPCSQAIEKAGVPTVVYAYSDSTDQAAGGAQYLISRGVRVTQAEKYAAASYQLNERWFKAAAARRPFITAKVASTLDGFIAAVDGTSKWITNAVSRADGHLIRHRADAVLIGTRTVRIDNPSLDARDSFGRRFEKQPLRVVFGETHIDEDYAITGHPNGDPENYLQVHSHDPQVLLDTLYDRGVRHLMIEGGPGMIGIFAREDLIDELVWYRATKVLGTGMSAVVRMVTQTLSEAREFQLDDLGMFPAVRTLHDSQLGTTDIATHMVPVPDIVAEIPIADS